jgi:hypothetical protein
MAGKVCPSRTRRRLSALPDRFHASPSCCWLDHRVRRATPGPSRCMGVRVDRRFERPGNIRCGCAAASRKNGGMGIRLAWSVAIHAPGVASSGTWSPGQALRTGGRDMIAGGPWRGRVGACRRFAISHREWAEAVGEDGCAGAAVVLCPHYRRRLEARRAARAPCPVRSRPRRRRPDQRLRVRHHGGGRNAVPPPRSSLMPTLATCRQRYCPLQRRSPSVRFGGMVTVSTARRCRVIGRDPGAG